MTDKDYFDNYFFTSNLTDYVCPGFGSFKCEPPAACARDPNTGKRYCCDTGDVCWTVTSTCKTDGTTLDCGSGSTTWCCLDQTEICTETSGQINICWASAHDTLTNISVTVLNDTYNSLSSAKPLSSSFTFDPLTLIALTQTSSTTATSTGTTTSTTSTGTDATQTSPNAAESSSASSSSGISGGAIAGAVVGGLAGLALIGLAVFFLFRRRRAAKPDEPGAAGIFEADSKPNTQANTPVPMYAKAEYQTPHEMGESFPASELPTTQSYYAPQELPASEPPAPTSGRYT